MATSHFPPTMGGMRAFPLFQDMFPANHLRVMDGLVFVVYVEDHDLVQGEVKQ